MRGFVLINTVFIISLIAFLILTMQYNLQLDLKMVNQLHVAHNDFHDLEDAAFAIIQDINLNNSLDNCDLNNEQSLVTYSNIIANGCKSSQNNIYYVVTDLGDFLCLRTIVDGNNLATHHYFLNIVNKNLPTKILQIRYALSGKALLCQNSVSRFISLGVVSWNLIYY